MELITAIVLNAEIQMVMLMVMKMETMMLMTMKVMVTEVEIYRYIQVILLGTKMEIEKMLRT